ncbi:16S rRNA (cytosine(1402)-N(4))-methyltransferase RsmH [Candidatus Acetothermia bacterium]|nr:16S rRNA (cytosine(1402)-N(4))-methyltransferase RsmH [Candidatus Acetothermia bacterium]
MKNDNEFFQAVEQTSGNLQSSFSAGEKQHIPVLCAETVALIAPRSGGIYVDGTIGLGGHSAAFFAAEQAITVVGIDLDKEALTIAADRLAPFSERVHLVHGNYRHIDDHLFRLGIDFVDGIILDLGPSSYQLDNPQRGFSFRRDGPLDMRMDRSSSQSAQDIVNRYSEEELTDLIRRYGEERFAARIAEAIVSARKESLIERSGQVAELVKRAIPRRFHSRRIHPATKTFQALRIAVNEELDNLNIGLAAAFAKLRLGGVLVVISFHSLEDRIVKRFFRDKERPCICPPELPVCRCNKQRSAEILTLKPLIPSPAEIADNPRARSAKLRAVRKCDQEEWTHG